MAQHPEFCLHTKERLSAVLLLRGLFRRQHHPNTTGANPRKSMCVTSSDEEKREGAISATEDGYCRPSRGEKRMKVAREMKSTMKSKFVSSYVIIPLSVIRPETRLSLLDVLLRHAFATSSISTRIQSVFFPHSGRLSSQYRFKTRPSLKPSGHHEPKRSRIQSSKVLP